jgi:hypothetical protein
MDQLAALIGFNPADDASMREFAAQLQKQTGWRSVSYKGEGVFAVDYAIEGVLTHDFVFPLFPRGSTIVPFVTARRRADGAVLVSAPAFAAGSGASPWALMGASMPEMGKIGTPKMSGRFAVRVTGEALTNNTEDGPVREADATLLRWKIDSSRQAAPEALIRAR